MILEAVMTLASLIIFFVILVSIIQVFLRPDRMNRILGIQICSTGMAAIFILQAALLKNQFIYDIALVLGILAAVTVISLIKLIMNK